MHTNTIVVFFYVDDFVALFRNGQAADFQAFHDSLIEAYNVKVLGDLRWFIGIEKSYIQKIASRFDCTTNSKPIKQPLGLELLEPFNQASPTNDIELFQALIGSLIYATIITRPDAAFAASRLSQFLQNPSPVHIQQAKRVIEFLYRDVNKVIEFDGQNHTCEAMSDASFADDHRDRKSTQGYAIKLFGGPASKELLAFHRLCKEITLDLESKDPAIQCDNQQTIRLLTQEMVTLVTKLRHVDIHHHWLRQEVQNGNLQVDWMPTAHMAADGLTKALQGQKFAEFQRQIGLVDLPLQN
ncbi:polyprotein [Hirsutella rhossiliensis]|uniref:Polyprotein n=1 Tax=Hirsutella rhossiliensis TaxID=111463 RepID=A0A9P8MN63_9HYPO|nr:polyprotein [Hirsutella rhossiliensis]KAH0958478.1 polyprotein [Hirsutella rhossiliensis]